jgi:hypothetical protein
MLCSVVAACLSDFGVCTSQAQYKLTEDGPGGPKHVGANVGYFNVNFNILYVSSSSFL